MLSSKQGKGWQLYVLPSAQTFFCAEVLTALSCFDLCSVISVLLIMETQ